MKRDKPKALSTEETMLKIFQQCLRKRPRKLIAFRVDLPRWNGKSVIESWTKDG